MGLVAIEDDAMDLLMEYDWPGNIRELEHAIERAINLCYFNVLELAHFEWLAPKVQKKKKIIAGKSIQDARAASEKEVILNALQATQGNKKKAAELLGIARPLLYQKMSRLGI